jgi:hypothetical protein
MLGRPVPVRITARQPGGLGYELSGLAAGSYLLHVRLPQGLVVQHLQAN